MRRIATIIVVVVVALGYVGAGLAFAAQRINAADHTLSNVVAHQNSLNKTLSNVDVTFKTLSSSSTYNPVQAKAAVDQWLAASRDAGITIDRDDTDLAGAANGLKQAPWLTPLSRTSLDREVTRLGHARDALSSARSVTSG